MSNPKNDPTPTSTPPSEGGGNPKNRLVLLGLAIFCLVIFSITGPMTAVLTKMMQGDPPLMARLELPSGAAEISLEEYRSARNYLSWSNRLMGVQTSPNTEEVLAYATKRMLAAEYSVAVSDAELAQFLQMQMRIFQAAKYQDIWRRMGFPSALQYEALVRELLKVSTLERLLASTAMPSESELLAQWAKDYGEMKLEYVVFTSEDFIDAAAALEPSEEELAEFYDTGLSYNQRAGLMNEEAVAFEALIISEAALGTEAVKAWNPQEEPSDEALQGFYDFRRFILYQRSADDPQIEIELTLSREELGDRLKRDFLLNRAALALLNEATSTEDLAAFATSKGVEMVVEAEPIPASQLPDLPRIGSSVLRQMAFSELNTFLNEPIILDGMALLARPSIQLSRAMPELTEVRESVVDYWRESRQQVLAKEAADAFVAAIPREEGALEGDPVSMQSADFSAAVAASGGELVTMDWVSRRVRPVSDPKWTSQDTLRPWLRNQVGSLLDDYVVNEVIGTLENPRDGASVVVLLAGRKDADTTRIWPGEIENARRTARSTAQRMFFDEQLSYEGLARAFKIEKTERADDQ